MMLLALAHGSKLLTEHLTHSRQVVNVMGPSARGFLQSLADDACSTGVVDRVSWLRIAQQYLSCALVRGRGIVFRYYCQRAAKSAGKDFRDGEEIISTRASKHLVTQKVHQRPVNADDFRFLA